MATNSKAEATEPLVAPSGGNTDSRKVEHIACRVGGLGKMSQSATPKRPCHPPGGRFCRGKEERGRLGDTRPRTRRIAFRASESPSDRPAPKRENACYTKCAATAASARNNSAIFQLGKKGMKRKHESSSSAFFTFYLFCCTMYKATARQQETHPSGKLLSAVYSGLAQKGP